MFAPLILRLSNKPISVLWSVALVKLRSVSPYTVSAAKPLEGDLPRETAYQLLHTPDQLHAGDVGLDSKNEKPTMFYIINGWTNLVIDHVNWSRMELLGFWVISSSWSLRSSLAGGLMVHREVDSPGKRTWRKSSLRNCWLKSGKAWTIALKESKVTT